jgi:HemK-like putative methylase
MQDYDNDRIQTTMRLLVHGFVPTTDITKLFDPDSNKKDEDSEPIIPTQVVKSISIVSQTRSNNAQYISRLDLELHTPLSSVLLRKLFYFHCQHPIIGNSNFTKPLKVNKDKGLCAALLAVSFIHPITKALISIKEEEPAKFGVMCEREARFYQNKLDRESEEIEKAGILPIDLEERKRGQLLAYMLGQKEFCGLRFKITKDCLIPRTSSETLVQASIAALDKKENVKVIDVGTGCGNILISILSKLPSASGVGIDISESALAVAKENANTLLEHPEQVEWRIQDMTHIADKNTYDLLVCNPPYLDYDKASKHKEHIAALEQEPAEALFAKNNGYEWYDVLSKVAPIIVKENGHVVLECGKDMMGKVLEIWSDWKQDEIYKDVQGWDRCLVLTKE